jgi:hypothetical protein
MIDSAIPPLGKYVKEMQSVYRRDFHTPVFIAALFTVAKGRKKIQVSIK